MELILRSRLVYACECVGVGCECLCCFGCSAGEEVASNEGEVGEEFSDFGVCEDEGEEGAEVADGCICGDELETD